MGFHRKTFNYLERHYLESIKDEIITDDNNADELHINDTDYKGDPFSSLNVNNGNSKRYLIKSYTIMFLVFLIGWISFLVYTDNSKLGDKHFSADDININFSPVDAVAKEKISKELSAKNDLSGTGLPIEEIVSVSNGYSDLKYNVLYNESEKNRFSIVESSWSNELSADRRVSEIKASGCFSGRTVNQKLSVSDGKNVYRVNISDYEKLVDARADVAKFKQSVRQITKLN